MSGSTTVPLRLTPELRARPWAGTRLSTADQHAGEAWLAHDGSLVSDGPARGRLVGDLSRQRGVTLVGRRGVEARSAGFPFLVKLIDTSDWLSVQVHPDDAQALSLEGEGSIGKTESWIVLEAGPRARVLVGPRADVEPEQVLSAIGTPELPDLLQECEVQAGDRIHVPACTLHAIGPDLLIYDIQQHFDITYRAWDWGRADRETHVSKSRAVADPSAVAIIDRDDLGGPDVRVAFSPFYRVDRLDVDGSSVHRDTAGESAHVVTVVDGDMTIVVGGFETDVSRHQTVVIPATSGSYIARADRPARALVAYAP